MQTFLDPQISCFHHPTIEAAEKTWLLIYCPLLWCQVLPAWAAVT